MISSSPESHHITLDKPSLENVGQEQPASAPDSIAEDNTFTWIAPRKIFKKAVLVDDDEPLVDTTAALELRSKKTERRQKKQRKKTEKTTVRSDTQNFLELPPELLHEVLSYLTPQDIFRLQRLNRATAAFIQRNEPSIAAAVIRRRYWTLARSFPLPVALERVDRRAQASLRSTAWQERIAIHKNPYQHIRRTDPTRFCTCTSCVIAWNNLGLILDLAHFQRYLRDREPIPMIARGAHPTWNETLVNAHARIVEAAVAHPMVYAAVLAKHLATVVGTLTRQVRVGKRTFHPRKLYHLSEADVASGTDAFLERPGDPSYEFPFHRDKYYDLEAYVPNRKWSKELLRWQYAAPGKPHEGDLAWVVARYAPDPEPDDGVETFVSAFAQKLRT